MGPIGSRLSGQQRWIGTTIVDPLTPKWAATAVVVAPPPGATEQMFYNFFLLFGPRLTSTPYPYLSSVPPPITTSSAPLTSLLPDYTWTMHAWPPPLRR